MRLIVAALLMWPLALFAVDRDLDDCTIGSTPTALAPLDLDNCTINDGDDITGILTGLASTYGNVYVRAPSRTANVVAAYTVFTVDDFYFYEDQDGRNTFLIQHASVNPATCAGNDCKGYFVLWSFQNFDTVTIGGAKLSITIQGNHPGLANCAAQYRPHIEAGLTAGQASICDTNFGLIEFRMSDSSTADLFDFRANVRFSQSYGLYSYNTTVGEPASTANLVLQTNVAGLFWATSGVFLHQGTYDIWTDPDRFVVSDPYVRVYGWDGTVPDQSGPDTPLVEVGLPVGCTAGNAVAQARLVGISAYYFNKLEGGMSIEYGGGGFAHRYAGLIGSADDPYVVRFKDWMITGPGTAYQSGVRVKRSPEGIFSKGDPADNDPDTGPARFVRLIALPSVGHGGASSALLNCGLDNNWVNGLSNFIRFENGNTGTGRSNRWQHWELAGDFDTGWRRGQLVYLASGGGATPQASYGHTLRVSSGTTITDSIAMHDRNTLTGPGTWTNITVADFAELVPGRGNLVTDTNVSGSIAIDTNTETTTITNVNFTGAARAVITVASSSTAVVSDLCVPDGSTITGAGTLTYEGSVQTLPYTIANSTANCSITADPRPGPVTGGSVQ